MGSLLLIDDDEKFLSDLAAKVEEQLAGSATVLQWSPQKSDEVPGAFSEHIRDDTVLVVTDYDLTKRGQTGLFGPSVVQWSQSRFVPVGDFSRGNVSALPKEPDLFEIRVPNGASAAAHIAELYRGFLQISNDLEAQPELMELGSPGAILAGILGAPDAESDLALYGLRLGTANGALMGKLVGGHPKDQSSTSADKRAMLSYVLGHLLLNAVLRFPGPIISLRALAAYVAVSEDEQPALSEFFEAAAYHGPFSRLNSDYFWLSTVDEVLREPLESLPGDLLADTQGEFNRVALERSLGRSLQRHTCDRCQGKNGGFFCPFTSRTVCVRQDCSVGPNSWVPQGATLCRIEREFYDEWSPILGF